MDSLPLRGLFAPAFIALAIAAGVINLRLNSEALTWLDLGFLVMGLAFARLTRRLLTSTMRILRHG